MLIFRENDIPKDTTKTFENFKKAIADSLSTYQKRLNNGKNNYYAENREYLFWIIEIGRCQTRS
jgi:hypothetical protein